MKKIFLLLLAIFLLINIKTQAQTEGTALWSSISIEKKIGKKFAIELHGQSRMVENITYTQTYLGELGLSYKIHKNWEITGYYRYIQRRKNELKEFKRRDRFYADLVFDHKIWKLKFANRLRYQNQFRDNDGGESEFDSSYLRNKIELSYPNKSKFTPYISGDLFYEIGGKIDQIRPKAGVSFKFNKHHSVDASVFSNVDLIGTESSAAIIGLGYKFKF
jgi:Protein of unknown function (DUF2490)